MWFAVIDVHDTSDFGRKLSGLSNHRNLPYIVNKNGDRWWFQQMCPVYRGSRKRDIPVYAYLTYHVYTVFAHTTIYILSGLPAMSKGLTPTTMVTHEDVVVFATAWCLQHGFWM